jgi:hypothetical protein
MQISLAPTYWLKNGPLKLVTSSSVPRVSPSKEESEPQSKRDLPDSGYYLPREKERDGDGWN